MKRLPMVGPTWTSVSWTMRSPAMDGGRRATGIRTGFTGTCPNARPTPKAAVPAPNTPTPALITRASRSRRSGEGAPGETCAQIHCESRASSTGISRTMRMKIQPIQT